MKRIVVAVVLLLGLGILFTSCNKVGGNSSLTGLWNSSYYEVYENDVMVGTEEDHDGYTIRFYDDGVSGTFNGYAEFTYTKSGNTITLTVPRSSKIDTGELIIMGGNKLKFVGFENEDGWHSPNRKDLVFEKQ